MGQTLTHGIYLPDEGERNCYSGLAANWQILDSSVGTIAANTAALAGKAPAVHTHTKADITDFPVYGTTAGTICEGNDSRLSDARTPTSHAHGSITNDGKLGTASRALITDGNKKITTSSVTSTELGYVAGVTSAIQTQINAKAADTDVVHKSGNETVNGIKSFPDGIVANVTGSATSATNDGSGNVISTTYGKLGTVNTWTGGNIFSAETYNNHVLLTNTTLDLSNGNPALSETNQVIILFTDKNKWQGKTYARLQSWTTSDQTITVLAATYRPDANTESDFSVWVSNTQNLKSFHPYGVSEAHLGTSSHKWKTFNGVNPGALSLPDYNNVLDVTSEIPVASLDGNTQININDYLPNKTGWLSIVIDDTAGNSIIATQGRSGGSTAYNNSRTFHTGAQSNGFISVFFPILADMNKFVSIKASSLIQMRFYYCLGNV